jgi:cytoskeletal protein RodZ
MSSSNIPPIPPIPSFPPLPPSEKPVENKRRWWLWGLVGCGGLIVGLVIIGIVAAIAIPMIMKARNANNDQAAYQSQTTMMADQQAPAQPPTSQEQAPLPENAMPAQPAEATAPPAAPPTGQEPAAQSAPQAPTGPTVGAGWLPAYPHARNVTQVGGSVEAGWKTGGLSYSTSDNEQTVIRFYQEQLTALGIPGQESYDESTKNHMYNAQTADGSRYVSVGASRVGNTTIVGIGYRSKN